MTLLINGRGTAAIWEEIRLSCCEGRDSVPVGAVEALFIVASPPGSEASKISVKEGVEGERYKEIEGER